MTGSDETIISSMCDLVGSADGATGLIEQTDVETGEIRLRCVRLDAWGGLLNVSHAEAELGWAEDMHSVALASLALRHPAIEMGDVAEALVGIAPEGLRHVASDGGVLFALTGDPDRFDGTAQGLYRVELKVSDHAVEALDLAPLGLSGGRFVTELVLIEGWLYVMVADAMAGFDIFRIRSTEVEPVFEVVVDLGARRFALNAAVSAIAPCPDAPPRTLLFGTAALAGGDAQFGNWGPELLRLGPDGTLDIVMGQPRFTPAGFKRSGSKCLPGFGLDRNAAVKAIASADVAGQMTTYVVLQDFLGATCADRRFAIPDFMDYMGSVTIYRSDNLVHWEEIPIDLPEDSGAVTALVATKSGLIIGHEGIGDSKLPVTFMRHRVKT